MNLLYYLGLLLIIPFNSAIASEWQSPHRPTKLDWLVMEMNAENRVRCIRPNPQSYCIGASFVGRSPNTVIIVMVTRGKVPVAEYNDDVTLYRELLADAANRYSAGSINIEVKKIDQGK